MHRVSFVVGTGRCGTKSINNLLNMQPGVEAGHEILWCSWYAKGRDLKNNFRFADAIAELKNLYLYVCVGFYFLPHVDHIFEKRSDSRVLCLERSCDEVVRSYVDKMWRANKGKYRNCWTDVNSVHWDRDRYIVGNWYMSYPNIDLPLEEAIEEFWCIYHEKAVGFAEKYPDRFIVRDMKKVLNTTEGQKEALEFLGVKEPIIEVGIHSPVSIGSYWYNRYYKDRSGRRCE